MSSVIPDFNDDPLRLNKFNAVKLKKDYLHFWGQEVLIEDYFYAVRQIFIAPSDHTLRNHFCDRYLTQYRDEKEDEELANQYNSNEFTVCVSLEAKEGADLIYTLTDFLDDLGVKYDLMKYYK